jgi:hypothetical protein
MSWLRVRAYSVPAAWVSPCAGLLGISVSQLPFQVDGAVGIKLVLADRLSELPTKREVHLCPLLNHVAHNGPGLEVYFESSLGKPVQRYHDETSRGRRQKHTIVMRSAAYKEEYGKDNHYNCDLAEFNTDIKSEKRVHQIVVRDADLAQDTGETESVK